MYRLETLCSNNKLFLEDSISYLQQMSKNIKQEESEQTQMLYTFHTFTALNRYTTRISVHYALFLTLTAFIPV